MILIICRRRPIVAIIYINELVISLVNINFSRPLIFDGLLNFNTYA